MDSFYSTIAYILARSILILFLSITNPRKVTSSLYYLYFSKSSKSLYFTSALSTYLIYFLYSCSILE